MNKDRVKDNKTIIDKNNIDIGKNKNLSANNSVNKDSKIEIKNYVNNNFNINLNIEKKDLIASVNALLTDDNNMKENLKNQEEIKN